MASIQRHPAANERPPDREGVPGLDFLRVESSDRDAAAGSLDRLIGEAARRITRHSPSAALRAASGGAVIIDIRSEDARELAGVIPGSLHIPRTVLEWRIALDSPWRNPHLGDQDQQLILICDHGYSSILAASTLVELGFSRAGDVIGGFEAWRECDLLVAPLRHRASPADGLPGTGPPD